MKLFLLLLLLPSAALAGSLDDYPGAPSEHGSVRVEVSIGSDGWPTACTVVRPSKVASLDAATCPLVMHTARFVGAAKQETPTTAQLTVHYIVPHAQQTAADLPIGQFDSVILYSPSRDAAQRANKAVGPGKARALERLPINGSPDYPTDAVNHREEGRVTIVIDVNASGKPSGCSVVRTSSYPTLDNATCKFALSHFRYRPAADFFGNPIPDDDLWTATWVLPR